MGWDFTHNITKKDLVAILLRATSSGHSIVAKALKGNSLWTVEQHIKENGSSVRYLCLYLLEQDKEHNGWGYKAMDESMGPYYYNCPLAFLSLLEAPSETAKLWREKVRAFHNKQEEIKARAKALVVGSKVQLIPGCTIHGVPLAEVTITSVKPLRASAFGGTFRLPKRMIAGAVASTESQGAAT